MDSKLTRDIDLATAIKGAEELLDCVKLLELSEPDRMEHHDIGMVLPEKDRRAALLDARRAVRMVEVALRPRRRAGGA